jgi:thioredoxin reductase (NADPH)
MLLRPQFSLVGISICIYDKKGDRKDNRTYDSTSFQKFAIMEKLVIVGSGPAGLTAALYAARANMDPLLIEGARSGGLAGGQLMIAGKVENFPGLPQSPEGPMLVQLMQEQVRSYNVRIISADALETNLQSRPFGVRCSNGTTYETHALIVASGAMARRLPIASEEKFWGMGVSACAVCDGALPMFRNKPLSVIGGGDTAAESALHLTQFASKVYLIHHRDALRASNIMQHRVLGNPKIEVLWRKSVVEFLGNNVLDGLQLKDEKTGGVSEIKVHGAFEAIGHLPNNAFLRDQIKLDESGHIVNRPGTSLTSMEGVFAAGDVADKRYRQAITASGSGCMAAMDAERWLHENGLMG